MKWKILQPKRTKNILQVLLANRGLRTKKQIKGFLNPKDPSKLTAKNVGISPLQISKAVKRIKNAIKNKEKIIVYGDYDTDGVCATAILWETLYQQGAQAMPFIPRREDGYGLKNEKLAQFAKEGIGLIVTVDQGIVALPQAKEAKKLGLDLIITDHHVPGKKKPKALAIVHTTKLSGAGVAWFLAKQLGIESGLDLATIGTISDVVPLLGANRSIVYHGLKKVRSTKRVGLLNLFELAGVDREKIGTYEVGYLIGPRLNAAGRIDDPIDSLRLICTPDKKRAQELAAVLNQRNRERQDLMEQTTVHARELWLKSDKKSKLIFVSHESYQEGIVGLVAGKLMEEFYRPTVVLAQGKEWSKASGRSIEEFNIIEAVRACADVLGPHGGHPKAAGFSVETTKIEVLRKRLIKIADKQLARQNLTPTLKIDMEIDLQDLNFSLYEEIEKMAPFGEGNPPPIFASRGVEILGTKTVGQNQAHLVLKIKPQFKTIGFGMGKLLPEISLGKSINIAYKLTFDEWDGNKKLQLKLKDIQPA